MSQTDGHTLCVAPMLDWTDRHARFFLRQISSKSLLYTEMVTTAALLRSGRASELLQFNVAEHPLAIQLGGSDPQDLAKCAKLAEDAGYDEINLNLGCPSSRVKAGRFGACLMAEPEQVVECLLAMRERVSVPVTAKIRLGIDTLDSYTYFSDFVSRLSETGCDTFIVHARKAWLKGLSPKENRSIPPLRYDWVYKLKKSQPTLNIILNGGVTSLDIAAQHLQHVDGVMIGREAYHNPWILAEVDTRFFALPSSPLLSRMHVLENMRAYISAEQRKGVKLKQVSRHMLGLFHGCAGARHFRRVLSSESDVNDVQILNKAVELLGTCSQ